MIGNEAINCNQAVINYERKNRKIKKPLQVFKKPLQVFKKPFRFLKNPFRFLKNL